MNSMGPGKCLFCKCDVEKKHELENLINVTVENCGKIDCVVNNAGWHPPATPFADTKVKILCH